MHPDSSRFVKPAASPELVPITTLIPIYLEPKETGISFQVLPAVPIMGEPVEKVDATSLSAGTVLSKSLPGWRAVIGPVPVRAVVRF